MKRCHLFIIFYLLLSYLYAGPSIQTERFCVLFDAGETTSLLPVIKKWEREGKDFQLLVLGTAEKLLHKELFEGRKWTLETLGASQKIDSSTSRTETLSLETLNILSKLEPKVILVGTASKAQEQLLKLYEKTIKVAFVDNFHYDRSSEAFLTAQQVAAAADLVFCPSQHTVDLFYQSMRSYQIVGKPSLEHWKQEMLKINRLEILSRLGLNPEGAPLVVFVGGYGYGYDLINPLFEEFAQRLKAHSYQPIILSHPKVAPQKITIVEALAIADFIVGYNSSVIFDAALMGKKSCFVVPQEAPYSHFAISRGLISKISTFEELVKWLASEKDPFPLCDILNIPKNSVQLIEEKIDASLVMDEEQLQLL